MERSVFANYSAFIRRVPCVHNSACLSRCLPPTHSPRPHRTAKEIADLQADLSRVRQLLHGIAGVVTELRDGPGPGQGSRGGTRDGARSPDAGMRRCVLRHVSTPRVHMLTRETQLPGAGFAPVAAGARQHCRDGSVSGADRAAGSPDWCGTHPITLGVICPQIDSRIPTHTAEGALIDCLTTLGRATRQLAAAQREQEESGVGGAFGDDFGNSGGPNGSTHPLIDDPTSVAALTATLARQRGALSDALAERITERSTPGRHRTRAALGLVSLGEGARAYTLLLDHHTACLDADLRTLRPAPTDDAQGMGVYTADVSHAVCSRLALAADDAMEAFRDEPARCSAFLAWAQGHVGRWSERLVQDGGPMGPEATSHEVAACARIALAHVALLERHGLTLAPLLARLLRPRVTLAVEEELKSGTPGPELLTATDSYLLSGSSAQLGALADVLVRVAQRRQQPVVQVSSMASAAVLSRQPSRTERALAAVSRKA